MCCKYIARTGRSGRNAAMGEDADNLIVKVA